MISDQLLNYIKQQKQDGVSDTQIREMLVSQGWQNQDLDEAFSHSSIQLDQGTLQEKSQELVDATDGASKNSVSEKGRKVRTPLIVVIIAWLMLIGGLFTLLGVLPFLFLGGFAKVGILLLIGIINLIKGVGLVVVSFGIRHMKRWALYTFTVLTVLAVLVTIYTYLTSQNKELTEFVDVGIQAVVTIYFWSISKRFG